MTRHFLQGRTDTELLWWHRRSFIRAATSWVAMGGFTAAQAQRRSNIVDRQGDVMVNGEALTNDRTIQTGDTIRTGPGSNLVFVIGNSSFQVRQNSSLTVERGPSLFAVSVLRVITGGIAAVFGKGSQRQSVTPTFTEVMRCTVIYTEVFEQQDSRTYFCNCYGTIDMDAGPDRVVAQSSYHQSFWGEAQPKNGHYLTAANAINHTDEEMEYLAKLVDQRTAWEIEGHRGVKNGMGYMDEQPASMHPANKLK